MYWSSNVDIEIPVDEIIEQILKSELENELDRRQKLKEVNPTLAEAEEKQTSDTIDYSIDPDDYDLLHSEDINEIGDYFSEDDCKEYLENNGYKVIDNRDIKIPDGFSTYVRNLPKHKQLDFICDLLEITRRSSKEEIKKEFEQILKLL